jgi:hypothetical protein
MSPNYKLEMMMNQQLGSEEYPVWTIGSIGGDLLIKRKNQPAPM